MSSIAPEFGQAFDLAYDEIAVARLVKRRARAPAHQDDILPITKYFGDLLGCDAHGTVLGNIGIVFDLVLRDDLGASRVVAMVFQNIGVAENRVCPINVDDRFAWSWLGSGVSALVTKTDSALGRGIWGRSDRAAYREWSSISDAP